MSKDGHGLCESFRFVGDTPGEAEWDNDSVSGGCFGLEQAAEPDI